MHFFKNKQIWMKVHVYLSLFFLPVALLYALTGALYLFDIREEAGANITEFRVESIEKGREKETILHELVTRNIRIPDNTNIKNMRGNLSMGSIAYSITLMKDKEGYKIRVVNRSLYGILLLMHKGKGKFYFDIIAVGFALSLAIFYLSGLVMTSFCKKKRKNALITFCLGLVITIFMIYLSI
ncbi:hypothetical protein CQA53_02935 [Helicobacter didelphidarum]|uniref:Peptidase n=1 Tax=Helicobacter didelphidarum TaxID=2040648 RepID=A0A3D8IP25_9HELI|nr:PepSY-associated TM helix domain-containing protein [Helicobacter didelphidarum]RDU66740.1 hypothetical protein CQA53_02935 [Helicobacter didelphidarum]